MSETKFVLIYQYGDSYPSPQSELIGREYIYETREEANEGLKKYLREKYRVGADILAEIDQKYFRGPLFPFPDPKHAYFVTEVQPFELRFLLNRLPFGEYHPVAEPKPEPVKKKGFQFNYEGFIEQWKKDNPGKW